MSMAQSVHYQENQRMRTPSAASLVDSAPPSTLYIHSMQPLNGNGNKRNEKILKQKT